MCLGSRVSNLRPHPPSLPLSGTGNKPLNFQIPSSRTLSQLPLCDSQHRYQLFVLRVHFNRPNIFMLFPQSHAMAKYKLKIYIPVDIICETKAENDHLELCCMKSPFLSARTSPGHRRPAGSPLGAGSSLKLSWAVSPVSTAPHGVCRLKLFIDLIICFSIGVKCI